MRIPKGLRAVLAEARGRGLADQNHPAIKRQEAQEAAATDKPVSFLAITNRHFRGANPNPPLDSSPGAVGCSRDEVKLSGPIIPEN